MKTDVIVVCYRSEQWLERCIASLLDSQVPIRSIYLIDNEHMCPAAVEKFRAFGSRVQYIRCKSNLNYGGGNNVGLTIAKSNRADFALIANPDTWFEMDSIAKLLDVFQARNDFGILSALQLEYASDEWSRWAHQHVELQSAEREVVETKWVEGSCMLLSRELIDAIGGFDSLYTMYYEDLDLCRRARLAGFKVGVVPAAKYHHHSNASFGQPTNPARVARIDCSQFRFVLTDPEHTWASNQARGLRWLCARIWNWRRGRHPGFWGAIGPIVKEYASNYSRLRKNWRARRGGDFHVALPRNLTSTVVSASEGDLV